MLASDPVKKTLKYSSGVVWGVPTAPMTSAAHPCIPEAPLGAEEASTTLGNYIDELKRNSAVGPLFASIALTTFQRKPDGSEAIFELTLKPLHPTP